VEGLGTRFSVALPVSQPEAGEEEAANTKQRR
jgi:hypothetical protein